MIITVTPQPAQPSTPPKPQPIFPSPMKPGTRGAGISTST
jgi:hypothetical protein